MTMETRFSRRGGMANWKEHKINEINLILKLLIVWWDCLSNVTIIKIWFSIQYNSVIVTVVSVYVTCDKQ